MVTCAMLIYQDLLTLCGLKLFLATVSIIYQNLRYIGNTLVLVLADFYTFFVFMETLKC